MLAKLKVLGYAEVALDRPTGFGEPPGQVARGHEFHYSEITADDGPTDGWQPAYTVRRRGVEPAAAGFARAHLLASYVHLHWASRPDAVRHFLTCCKERL